MRKTSALFVMLVLISLGSLAACFSLPPVSPAARSAPASPKTPGCPRASMPAVLLVDRQDGQTRSRCLVASETPNEPDGSQDAPQPISPPVDGVLGVCALRADILVSYASYDDSRVQQRIGSSALGRIDLFVRAGQCLMPRQAVGLGSVTITEVWFAPFFGAGTLGDATPQPHLIHALRTPACSPQQDTLALWSGMSPIKRCFAGLGMLHLTSPLLGVNRICSGDAAGEVFFHLATLISGLEVQLAPHTCVSIPLLLHEPAIRIDTVLIASPEGDEAGPGKTKAVSLAGETARWVFLEHVWTCEVHPYDIPSFAGWQVPGAPAGDTPGARRDCAAGAR